MNLIKLVLVSALCLNFPLAEAIAQDSQSDQMSKDLGAKEFTFAPVVGYSTFDSFTLGARVGLGISVSNRWQMIGEGSLATSISNGSSEVHLLVGPQFNLSESIRNSFFVAGGLGVGTRTNANDNKSAFLFSRIGYRVAISETFNWLPSLSVVNERSILDFELSLLNFSCFF